MNKIYSPKCLLMNSKEIASWANTLIKRDVLTEKDFEGEESRIVGNLCDCLGNGEFILYSNHSKDVINGKKAYMRCRICGKVSHL